MTVVAHSKFEPHSDPRVAAASPEGAAYPAAASDGDDQPPDFMRRISEHLGWADDRGGVLGNVVSPGARVLIKPNFVLHQNEGPWGLEPLVTHPSLVRVATLAALRAGASEVVIGDAPIQSCDFDQLMLLTGLGQWAADLMNREPRFKGIRDFRRTTCVLVNGVRVSSEHIQPEENFVLFDLKEESLLEPVTDRKNAFRVTWYDPRLMAKTHHAGRHQFLVAREVLEADVIINLPKLKTHKKAGVTCALKNLIGINGNKEYLPHHRLGGDAAGGDCYPGDSSVKRALEYVADQQNQTASYVKGSFWHGMTFALVRLSRLSGDRLGYEGSWSGNDTIWRTCLDLNRILLYGRADGTMSEQVQRRTIHLADAVVAGHGEGPLAPQPFPLGMVLGAQNAAAMDWVGAKLLGYDPHKITIAREAFGGFRWPLVSFGHDDVVLIGDAPTARSEQSRFFAERARGVVHPIGWRDAAATPSAEPAEAARSEQGLSLEG